MFGITCIPSYFGDITQLPNITFDIYDDMTRTNHSNMHTTINNNITTNNMDSNVNNDNEIISNNNDDNSSIPMLNVKHTTILVNNEQLYRKYQDMIAEYKQRSDTIIEKDIHGNDIIFTNNATGIIIGNPLLSKTCYNHYFNEINAYNDTAWNDILKEQKFDLPWFYSRESLDAVLSKRHSARSWLIDRSKRIAKYMGNDPNIPGSISHVSFYNIPKTGVYNNIYYFSL